MRKCNLRYGFRDRMRKHKRNIGIFKTSKWNEIQSRMPKYSGLKVALVKKTDFDNLDALIPKIIETADSLAPKITQYIKAI